MSYSLAGCTVTKAYLHVKIHFAGAVPIDSAAGDAVSKSSYERIWSVVRRIPRGRVATYGQIARVAGLPRQARMVGYALNALSDEAARTVRAAKSVPWQRVINAQGRVSLRAFAGPEDVQRKLLEREGVRFDARDRVDLQRFGWRPSV